MPLGTARNAGPAVRVGIRQDVERAFDVLKRRTHGVSMRSGWRKRTTAPPHVRAYRPTDRATQRGQQSHGESGFRPKVRTRTPENIELSPKRGRPRRATEKDLKSHRDAMKTQHAVRWGPAKGCPAEGCPAKGAPAKCSFTCAGRPRRPSEARARPPAFPPQQADPGARRD